MLVEQQMFSIYSNLVDKTHNEEFYTALRERYYLDSVLLPYSKQVLDTR